MPKEQYKADRGQDNQNTKKEEQHDSNKKLAKVAAKGAANYFTGGKGGAIVDKLANTKLGDKALDKMAKTVDKNPALSKVSKKLNDTGMTDAADKGLSLMNSSGTKGNIGKNVNGVDNSIKTNKQNRTPNMKNNDDSSNKQKVSTKDSSKKNKSKANTLDFVSKKENEDGSTSLNIDFIKFAIKHPHIALICIGILFFIIIIGGVVCSVISGGENGNQIEANDSTCTTTSNPNQESKHPARFTTYSGRSLGGTLGSIDTYIREGTVYFENGYAMFKGGTKSYGEAGTNYIIVAMATEYLFGNCVNSSCSYRWEKVSDIPYYKYGDTFTVGINFTGKKNMTKEYNAIVLDSCGACMEFSLNAPSYWKYSPHSEREKQNASSSQNVKVDLYTGLVDGGGDSISDMGYVMGGTSNNICVGEVDLGNLVTGISDTKLLVDKSLNSLLGDSGINDLNNQIKTNVEKYGSGTGKGVAAAAITLINSLKAQGYRLPYYWAGGHGTISVGVKPSWGSQVPGSMSRGGRMYYYDSLDCSGFVSWAIKNGGCSNFTANSSSTFASMGESEDATDAKAGDILVKGGSHVTLVVQNNNGNIILAESSGGTGGVHFSEYDSSRFSGYEFRDMSSVYSSNMCK